MANGTMRAIDKMRIVAGLRSHLLPVHVISTSTSTLPASSAREYHGDPGPSSVSSRHERRRQFRQSAALNQGRMAQRADRGVLDQLLNAPASSARPSSPSPRNDLDRDYETELGRGSPTRPPRPSRPTRMKAPPPRLLRNAPRSPSSRPRSVQVGVQVQVEGPRPDSFRRRTQGPHATHDENPYTTSTRLKRWIEKHKSNSKSRGVLSPNDTEEVIKIVTDAPSYMVNAPVWNILLGYMGRERKMDMMWKLYNDMKKRGIKPTSRTYSTLLNAYAGVPHAQESADFTSRPPEQRTLSRVTIIFEHSQAHIRQCQSNLAYEQRLAGPDSDPAIANDLETSASEIDLAPTNAYLKFLGRHGMWEEMQRAFLSLDTEGRLAPDLVTYTTMFASLYHVSRARERTASGAEMKESFAVGPIARGLWDQFVRQFSKPRQASSSSAPEHGESTQLSTAGKIDNVLLTHVLRCLLRGRPEDQRLATTLVGQIWGLAAPGQSTIASSSFSSESSKSNTDLSSNMRTPLPRLTIDIPSATSFISMLTSTRKPALASHFAHLLLSDSALQRSFDIQFFRSAIRAFAETGDVTAITTIFDSYQPPTGAEGWPMGMWKDALSAARWAGDFPSSLALFRRATHLPEGVELLDPLDKSEPKLKEYRWTPPNGQARDARGAVWFKPRPVVPDAYMVSTVIRTAMQRGKGEVKQALAVWRWLRDQGMISAGTGKGHAKRAEEDGKVLEMDVQRAMERVA